MYKDRSMSKYEQTGVFSSFRPRFGIKCDRQSSDLF